MGCIQLSIKEEYQKQFARTKGTIRYEREKVNMGSKSGVTLFVDIPISARIFIRCAESTTSPRLKSTQGNALSIAICINLVGIGPIWLMRVRLIDEKLKQLRVCVS